jgi:hypothetical protein
MSDEAKVVFQGKTNWANRGKAAIKTTPITSTGKKDRGERYEGVVESIIAKTFSTGSSGLTVKYQISGEKNPVYENVVLYSAPSGDGIRSATKYGESTLKRRLMACGLDKKGVLDTVATLNTNAPDFSKVAGSRVCVYLQDRTYMGKNYKNVTAVYPLD